MDYSLIYRLSFSLFSFDPANMRWFNMKRMLIILLMVPLFVAMMILNRICLFLDHIFFPAFKRQNIKKPVFIIAAPRSATTYLFHLLAADRNHFTAFRLWEIIFAPSILQKYFLSGLFRVDKIFGNPVKKIILFLEDQFIGKFKHIHKIGLDMPEEDEAILLWNMSTIYLNFFFPDTDHFKDYFAFDDTMPAKRKEAIMHFYNGSVLRHNYFFNRDGRKRFLSKNPAMMAKIESLHRYYPDATILNINRCPASTIPSTLALNNHIYHFFSSIKASKEMNEKTMGILVGWYQMAGKHLHQYYPHQTIEIDFRKLVSGDESTRQMICDGLFLNPEIFKYEVTGRIQKEDHQSRNQYIELSGKELEDVMKEIPFMEIYCTGKEK